MDLSNYQTLILTLKRLPPIPNDPVNITEEINYQSQTNYEFDYEEYRSFHPIDEEINNYLLAKQQEWQINLYDYDEVVIETEEIITVEIKRIIVIEEQIEDQGLDFYEFDYSEYRQYHPFDISDSQRPYSDFLDLSKYDELIIEVEESIEQVVTVKRIIIEE